MSNSEIVRNIIATLDKANPFVEEGSGLQAIRRGENYHISIEEGEDGTSIVIENDPGLFRERFVILPTMHFTHFTEYSDPSYDYLSWSRGPTSDIPLGCDVYKSIVDYMISSVMAATGIDLGDIFADELSQCVQ